VLLEGAALALEMIIAALYACGLASAKLVCVMMWLYLISWALAWRCHCYGLSGNLVLYSSSGS